MVWGFRLAVSRRMLVAIGLVALLGVMPATTAYAQDAAAPAQSAPDAFKFPQDNVILVWTIKPEKAADFESAWLAIKDKLSKNEKAELKELGTSLNILKVDAPPAAGAAAPVVYLFHLNPPSKTQSYEPTKLIYYSGAFPDRPEADTIYNKIKDAVQSIIPWPLKKIGG